MDHITSRFRRTKREPTMSPTPHDLRPASASSSPVALGPKSSLPSLSLSVNTTPLTTPPGSSHTSHGLLPRSPLRGLNHFRNAHKRARSPASQQSDTSAAMSSLSPVDMSADHLASPSAKSGKPEMPPFLKLSDTKIEARFQELIWLERMRSQQGMQNPSPHFQFARVITPETKLLDRYANIQPWANNRVHLDVPEGKLDYINASPILSPSPLRPETRPRFHYIAMQGPKFNTVDHTWRMISQLEGPVVIVMLTDTHDGYMEKCYPYFPRDFHDRVEVGETDEFADGFRAWVECVSVEEKLNGAIELRKIILHVDGREDMTVWHLLYRRWPDFGVPKVEDHDSFFELMKLSRELNTRPDNPRIIHCSAGVGRTGTFIALETLMREVEEGAMDDMDPEQNDNGSDVVFKTVNHLREQRRTMVQADSQYAFIYKVLRRQWLARHDLPDKVPENGRAPKSYTTPLSKTTFGQVRKPRRARQPPSPTDNESSDDSTPGGVSLHSTGS